jgi:hypothetical protein
MPLSSSDGHDVRRWDAKASSDETEFGLTTGKVTTWPGAASETPGVKSL